MARRPRAESSGKVRHHTGTSAESPKRGTSSFGPGCENSEQAVQRVEGQPRPRLLVCMYECIIFDSQDSIGLLRLNRPEKLNAFGGPIRDEILDLLAKIASDDNIRVLIVTGEGRGFSAGGDIDHLKYLRENKDEPGFRSVLAKGQQITRAMRALPKPVIAAVNGPCAGAGFSFALGCDIRVASDLATF